jgi:hypothetical protein
MKYADFGLRTAINQRTVAIYLADEKQDSPANTACPVSYSLYCNIVEVCLRIKLTHDLQKVNNLFLGYSKTIF